MIALANGRDIELGGLTDATKANVDALKISLRRCRRRKRSAAENDALQDGPQLCNRWHWWRK